MAQGNHEPADAAGDFSQGGAECFRLQKRIEWDPARMKASNAPEADALIRKRYRDGFGIES